GLTPDSTTGSRLNGWAQKNRQGWWFDMAKRMGLSCASLQIRQPSPLSMAVAVELRSRNLLICNELH
ncbi:MAG: hypothetical protein P1U87_04085, partial [Verrucomicrobiales bacterium]|nr:hypothetical protein [Verrucomicrobiales bacterium]